MSAPDTTTDLAGIRKRRAETTAEIATADVALEKADALLTPLPYRQHAAAG